MSDIVTRARELLAEITPYPWRIAQNDHTIFGVGVDAGHYVGIAHDADAEFIAAAPQLVADLADRIESAESLLRALVDADDCWFDHNGDCQAHGFFDGPCAHEQAKQFLGMKEADRG